MYITIPVSSVSDPDPVGSGFKLPDWIRIQIARLDPVPYSESESGSVFGIWISIRNPDPDPESEIEL